MTMKHRSLQKSLACYWGSFSRLCFLLGLLIVLSAIIWKQNKEKCKYQKWEESGLKGPNRKKTIDLKNITSKKLQYQNLTVMESATGPLAIPYKYLLGSHPPKKRFLTIGISSVHNEKEQHLLGTIESIFSHCLPEELKLITVVIYLADNSSKLNEQSLKKIEAQFSVHINAGRLLVIQSSLASYPPLHPLKMDVLGCEKGKYKTKQNVDYAYLVNFCANLSQYYLMLENDIVCATGFVSVIQSYVRTLKQSWTTIAFSRLGCIGKLYHSSDLTKLGRFLLMFYDEIPGDWLQTFFHKAKAQEEAIFFHPSLFQHIGKVSSFHNVEGQRIHPEFEEDAGDFGDFPTASCFTNIPIYANYIPANVCPPGKGVFWGKNVTSKSFFTIVFAHPIVPQKIQIYTGSAVYNTDILCYGYVEKGSLKIHIRGHQTCLTFKRIGDFKNGLFKMEDKSNNDDIECLRIQATAPQKHWLRIRRISIWVKKS
ncbi:alpha-1,3-mannosyl-glycoprotein 4-beta-N-acetylglucosaminyltransferase C-like [Rhineura floridana]|uniref:alpha-1,3-mannosyl-glycoprotein 4-beta-N-acetylglucosaminyltransferase C-like n=1 Tax=Rhineura floridana TaxID=261503 RepID=UPI002AC8840F|nr:alpha-1,3-mannosyl-glycoprotein 4-beta-N-acetylglucosaminyltransferase C-like [Rhineura floridana]